MRYDAGRKTVELDVGASLYALAHERAHEQQHAAGTMLWRWHARLRHVPILSAWTRFLVELEAAVIARRVLRALGFWRPSHGREMVRGLVSYLIPRFPRRART